MPTTGNFRPASRIVPPGWRWSWPARPSPTTTCPALGCLAGGVHELDARRTRRGPARRRSTDGIAPDGARHQLERGGLGDERLGSHARQQRQWQDGVVGSPGVGLEQSEVGIAQMDELSGGPVQASREGQQGQHRCHPHGDPGRGQGGAGGPPPDVGHDQAEHRLRLCPTGRVKNGREPPPGPDVAGSLAGTTLMLTVGRQVMTKVISRWLGGGGAGGWSRSSAPAC